VPDYEPDELMALLATVPRNTPQRTEALYLVARHSCERGEIERAVQCLEELLEAAPDHRGGLFYLGQVYLALADYEAAVRAFERALGCTQDGLDADDPAASEALIHCGLGDAYQGLAGLHYQQALQLDGNCETAQSALQSLASTGELEIEVTGEGGKQRNGQSGNWATGQSGNWAIKQPAPAS
jgi:tetratricopeptide (TPR) repeat protein